MFLVHTLYLVGAEIWLSRLKQKMMSELAFPTGRDGATFRDKGTEIPSLSRDKGTTGQAQNLATGRDGTGF